jgi:hypothetical protein
MLAKFNFPRNKNIGRFSSKDLFFVITSKLEKAQNAMSELTK